MDILDDFAAERYLEEAIESDGKEIKMFLPGACVWLWEGTGVAYEGRKEHAIFVMTLRA
jgi:hypothetical protein